MVDKNQIAQSVPAYVGPSAQWLLKSVYSYRINPLTHNENERLQTHRLSFVTFQLALIACSIGYHDIPSPLVSLVAMSKRISFTVSGKVQGVCFR